MRCRRSSRDVDADLDAVEIEVVDDADGFARVVEELAVQQVQPGVEHRARRLRCVGKAGCRSEFIGRLR